MPLLCTVDKEVFLNDSPRTRTAVGSVFLQMWADFLCMCPLGRISSHWTSVLHRTEQALRMLMVHFNPADFTSIQRIYNFSGETLFPIPLTIGCTL